MKQRLPRGGEKLFPLFERAQREARINFIRSVAHANDARFAAGAGTGIGGPIGIEQNHALLTLNQMPCGPRAERSSADDCYVECGLRCHLWLEFRRVHQPTYTG